MRRSRRSEARRARVLLAACLSAATLPAAARAEQTAPASPATPWWQRITFGGDFRERYEGFFREGDPSRNRARFRLRVTMTAQVNDEVRFGLRLGSGDLGDPISLNEDFSDFLTRKPISIDQAFIAYQPAWATRLSVVGGKFPFPVTRTQLVWDDDVNWEGVYEELRVARGDRLSFKLVAVQSPIRESRAQPDSFLFGGYAEATLRAGPHTVQLSAADYGFREIDRLATAIAAGELDTTNTNLVRRNAAGSVVGFASRFNLVDVIAQVTLATPRREYPLRLLLDWVTNTRAASPDDTGLWLTAAYGRAAAPKTYALSYAIARIEQEAVLSPFIYSDIPGSDIWMHAVGASFAPLPRFALDGLAIITRRLASTEPWLTRVQVDARVSF